MFDKWVKTRFKSETLYIQILLINNKQLSILWITMYM